MADLFIKVWFRSHQILFIYYLLKYIYTGLAYYIAVFFLCVQLKNKNWHKTIRLIIKLYIALSIKTVGGVGFWNFPHHMVLC